VVVVVVVVAAVGFQGGVAVNAASGRQRRLWTATPPLDGNAASGW
jgi:hypothetical protein